MGPQHPSTHGVLRLVLELDGEVIQSVMPTIGYLHTGIEKTAEQKKWQQVIPLVERMDYLGAQSNSLAYAHGGGEAARARDAGARQGHPRPHRRAAAHRQPSDLARHARHGNRRGVDAVLRDPRARAAPQHQRADCRLPVLPELHPHRRPARGSAARLPRGGQRVPRSVPGKDRRVRRAAHEERHLPPADRRRRRGHAGRCAAVGSGRSDPARRRIRLRRAQVLPVSRLRDLRLQCPDGDRGRRLRAVSRARRGDARERQDLQAGASRGSRRPASGRATTRAWCRRRRTRSTRRWRR